MQEFEDEAVEGSVFEGAAVGFGERGAEGEGDYYVVGVFLGAGRGWVRFRVIWYFMAGWEAHILSTGD